MQQTQSAQKNYLQAEVHTATPQKLQLLLVEAAIKNIHRTKQAWKESKFDVGFETLSRSQDIVAEILCSLDVEGNPDIAKRLGSIYLFIFRRLAEGGMSHDEGKLDDALRVLNSERETWRLVCEKFGSTLGQTPGADATASRSAHGDSAEFTSSTASSDATASSARLDLGSYGNPTGGAKVLVPQPTEAPATFSKPFGAPFASGVRPLGASAIQTDSVLSGNKPASPVSEMPGTYYTAKPGLGNLDNLSTKTPSAPGNNWEV